MNRRCAARRSRDHPATFTSTGVERQLKLELCRIRDNPETVFETSKFRPYFLNVSDHSAKQDNSWMSSLLGAKMSMACRYRSVILPPMLTSFARRQSGRPPEWLAAARAKHTHRVGTTAAPKDPRSTRQSLDKPASQRSRDSGGDGNSSRPTPLDSTRLTGSGCGSYFGRNVSHHCRRHTHKFFRRRSTRGLTSDASRVSDSRKYS